jgi:uncharacterized protein (TIGR02118 family)
MIVVYAKPRDPEGFDKHYFDVHVPLAKTLPGLRKYEISEGAVVPITGGPEPYRVASLYFDDMAAIKTAFASETGRACAADRKQLAPDDAVQIYLFDTRDL